MKTSYTQLDFQCPKKWESMKITDGGRFCSECKKTVRDFSNEPSDKLRSLVEINNEEELCGNFYAYQLNKPFNNWKDKIISVYQKNVSPQKANRINRSLVLFFITIVMIITGCQRHLRGKIRKVDHCKSKKHSHQTEQTNSQPANK